MPLIHRVSEIGLKKNRSSIPDFSWKSSLPLEEISKSKYLHFDIKSLFPGKFSYPYHFHRNAEELFIILEGEATLRSPENYQTISKGDIIFFEEGSSGAHQLYNHSDDQSPTSCIAGGMRKPPRRGHCYRKAPKGTV